VRSLPNSFVGQDAEHTEDAERTEVSDFDAHV